MAETSTPRTDAFMDRIADRIKSGSLTDKDAAIEMILELRKRETDLQHLARVAGEALGEYLMAGHKEARRLASIKAKAALSEITRIQSQTT